MREKLNLYKLSEKEANRVKAGACPCSCPFINPILYVVMLGANAQASWAGGPDPYPEPA